VPFLGQSIISTMQKRGFWSWLVTFFLVAGAVTLSVPALSTPAEKARQAVLPLTFNYLTWEIKAFLMKGMQTGVNPALTLNPQAQHDLVVKTIRLTNELVGLEGGIGQAYAAAEGADPARELRDDMARQKELQNKLSYLRPLAESILEAQVNEVLVEEGIARLGSAIPPLLFHITPLPTALITSPRDAIRQDSNISLLAELTLEEIAQLEREVEEKTGQSALVVNVGGIGVYPTMVMRSSSLPWILDTIAHEWTHNYLSLRPLGFLYDKTPELRTMNETAATLAGMEISRSVLEQYYPEFLPPTWDESAAASISAGEQPEPAAVFDFRAEMHATRVRVDELLAAGKIEQAEAYMEARRLVFVEQGYDLRKLNQAYFAFHGAYAALPGGAAGEDPVGPAVNELRASSDSLADFLRTIGRMDSYEDLLDHNTRVREER